MGLAASAAAYNAAVKFEDAKLPALPRRKAGRPRSSDSQYGTCAYALILCMTHTSAFSALTWYARYDAAVQMVARAKGNRRIVTDVA